MHQDVKMTDSKQAYLQSDKAVLHYSFDIIPIKPYRRMLWHSAPQQQRSLLLLVITHKFNLHTGWFCWDVADAGTGET